MNFKLTEEQKAFEKMVREFAEKEIKPIASEIDRKGRFPSEIIKKWENSD